MGLAGSRGARPRRRVHRSRLLRPERADADRDRGSVTLDGVSLTVNRLVPEVNPHGFEVMLIPHTLSVTTLGALSPGDTVNLEVDLLARYVVRYLQAGHAPTQQPQDESSLLATLARAGLEL
ncbi:MAG: hypothetical protein R3B89_26365 [Polyangiaceae bacterium]